jgi:hypothetical protein
MSTLATLEGNVAGALGLDWDSSSPTAGDGPRLLGWANDAVIDMLRRTHCYVSSATLTMTANTGDYRLDSSILAIEDIYMTSSGTNYKVKRITTTEMLDLRLYNSSSSIMQLYALSGVDMLMVYPLPLQADTLTIYYVPKPTALANASDDPSNGTLGGIPTEYHYGLELYMMWKAADATDDDGSQNGETYRRMYLGDPSAPPGTEQRDGFIGTMKKDIRRKGGKHQAAMQVPPRGRRLYVPPAGVDTGSRY